MQEQLGPQASAVPSGTEGKETNILFGPGGALVSIVWSRGRPAWASGLQDNYSLAYSVGKLGRE